MRDTLSKLMALGAGALAMYYFDPRSGAERRALLAGLVKGGLQQGRSDARQAAIRRRGRGRAFHHIPSTDPQRDARLRDLIRERLGRMVSHPRAIDVQVEEGVVRLSGDVLSKERDGLLLQVNDIPGVEKLVNAMTAHEHPDSLATLEARQEAELAG
ncbi:BON domain-containing protein [Caenimonas sedimenti]|uniref:BON domain-containing protein n=1 Tax=Caenimonas sedimenti TaxID=2596921 RepID=A0A562ZXG0_9BURK|nr:BON domain-containing protein [Caenimonas sedimenti]TWO73302.1 BON domain-containing protein [Caenimonas sedimenti]